MNMSWIQSFRRIPLSDIIAATKNFHQTSRLGSGGFGIVYGGNITLDGTAVFVAIKRMTEVDEDTLKQFWSEVNVLSSLRHRNITSLLGFCDENGEKLLIYEFIPNHNLEVHLHHRREDIPWIRRLDILIGAAKGLVYLHEETAVRTGVIHGDIKSSNVLLDYDFHPKLSDFGIARICSKSDPTHVTTIPKGSVGYVDPHFYVSGVIRRKSDVYGFGVLLFEVLTRRFAAGDREYAGTDNVAKWAQRYIAQGNLTVIADPAIREHISPDALSKYLRLADRCCHFVPEPRPVMTAVLAELEDVRALQLNFDAGGGESWKSKGRALFSNLFTRAT